jgi:phosphoribosyl-ATP pyrophosphohydrolase/phosphoribosyl-AMP cyclohydrolase
MNTDELDFSKLDGLIPAVVQHATTGVVLMVGYMNREAVEETLRTGLVTFWSRSRRTLWRKGETSGNTLRLVDAISDCDSDALLILAVPAGPVCHRGTESCFDATADGPADILRRLEEVIATRRTQMPEQSHTARLFAAGIERIAQKVGEEATEVVVAGLKQDTASLRAEAADLLYHLLVLLNARDVSWTDVLRELERRRK